jgi:hypothetical protein
MEVYRNLGRDNMGRKKKGITIEEGLIDIATDLCLFSPTLPPPKQQGCVAGAETFGWSQSWSRNKVSAPAPGETKSKRLFRQYGSGGQVTFKK